MRSEIDQQLQQRLIAYFEKHLESRFDELECRQIRTLLEVYYRHVAAVDLEESEIVDLVGAVVAHWQLLREHRAGRVSVRVYNPAFEEHGWQSPHTVIETVTEDMSFLVDSLSMALNRAGVTIHLTIHPVLATLRDKQGRLEEIAEPSGQQKRAESIISLQIEKQPTAEALRTLKQKIEGVLRDVALANQDWNLMRRRVAEISESFSVGESGGGEGDAEFQAFLDWAGDDHFTFLAFCTFDLETGSQGQRLVVDDNSRLGLFRMESGYDPQAIVPVLSDRYTGFPCPLVVTKANTQSTVHRPAHMDYIGVKRHDAKGEVDGLHCIVGFFTIAAYSSPPADIPLLRSKVSEVLAASRLAAHSFSSKVLQTILQTFPRDDLFQIPVEKLQEIAFGILGLQERHRTRLFLFRDTFSRFFSVLVYLPKEKYNRELRLQLQQVLIDELGGVGVEFDTLFSESTLARIHFIVHTRPDESIDFDPLQLESRVVEVSKTWQDGLREALQERYGEADTARLMKQYGHSFPGGYREDFLPRTAAADITRFEAARSSGSLAMHFYRHFSDAESRVHFRLYSLRQPVPLSEAIPILENMGLSVFGERPYRIVDALGEVWIHDFSMRYEEMAEALNEEVSDRFQSAFRRIWEGEADSDGFNQLILGAALSWRQVVILRAYSKYLQQIKTPFSQSYIIRTLARNPKVTHLLVELFEYRFDPAVARTERLLTDLLSRIESLLESVSSLDEDRILRSFVNLFMATLRTNYYQRNGQGEPKSYLSFKIDPSLVSNMPLPRPMYEIFVFSVRMAGVHLRGGKVARGGLRWSDRMEDFRTEVLGLMKAQMVKNTVIVPVGSKGGFIAKRLPPSGDREATAAEVVTCYKTFLSGMLDLTDNLIDGKVHRPDALINYDDDDPYLVIAADKGTATFSDIANGVAAEYGFWLGDAFASGGSVGYDHKRMAITARGAWESVKRNFRELGIDIQNRDFRVVGIGDMSGDVFGNGMLLSHHIRLVGAFNHMHIFLDPDPDAEASFAERSRLFALSRSSWGDYDRKLISSGGGVFSRSLKSIPLSAQARTMLGVKQEHMTPNEVITALLKAPVDLLWNGGI
ncbi:MAG: NAD-glutamate dehydrogenase, partial [Gammaproteobacteria bacterium]|nr:NAD-glutamate dehydrogenase [Gammaproteobacteria bacterium]